MSGDVTVVSGTTYDVTIGFEYSLTVDAGATAVSTTFDGLSAGYIYGVAKNSIFDLSSSADLYGENGGTIENSQIYNFGGGNDGGAFEDLYGNSKDIGSTISTQGYLITESSLATVTKEVVENGGQIYLDYGATGTHILIDSGGEVEVGVGPGTIQSSTIKSGGVVFIGDKGAIGIDDTINAGGGEVVEFKGKDIAPIVAGVLDVNFPNATESATLKGATLENGLIQVASEGIVTGAIDFSATGGTFVINPDTTISAARFEDLYNEGTIIFEGTSYVSGDSAKLNHKTHILTLDLNGTTETLQLGGDYAGDKFLLNSVLFSGTQSTELTVLGPESSNTEIQSKQKMPFMRPTEATDTLAAFHIEAAIVPEKAAQLARIETSHQYSWAAEKIAEAVHHGIAMAVVSGSS